MPSTLNPLPLNLTEGPFVSPALAIGRVPYVKCPSVTCEVDLLAD